MRLLEYQAKNLLTSYSIPVPRGQFVRGEEEIEGFQEERVLKAQVPIGGRGKAGGILFASDPEEAREKGSRLLRSDVRGYRVRGLLLEERLSLERELYLGIAMDRGSGLPILLVSPEGGVEVESVDDYKIARWHLHPFVGLRGYHKLGVAKFLGLEGDLGRQLGDLMEALWSLFWRMDCELVEINPLGVTDRLIAADAKVIINDDALYRHPDLPVQQEEMTELERESVERGISFVQLDGTIGVIANGAGLTMATLDNLSRHGGGGGVFLDLGGTDDVDTVVQAFSLMVKARPSVILLNIFGGITKCDTVAKGVVEAKERLDIQIPMVARIRGVNERGAREILDGAGIHALGDLDEACRMASHLEVGE
ncbi:MAG: ATP-grasp domain-containing protein [Methanomassiliicoccales archaeon]